MKPHGIVLECPTGCHGDRHVGIYNPLSLASCPISCCPVWGWGWTVKVFVVYVLGLFSSHCCCLRCESHLVVYGDLPGRRCAGLLGSLQGPSGQVSSPIKYQKQPGINPLWGPLVCSRCMANMPLLCPSEHDSTSMDTQLKIRKHNQTGKMKLLLIRHNHFLYAWCMVKTRVNCKF